MINMLNKSVITHYGSYYNIYCYCMWYDDNEGYERIIIAIIIIIIACIAGYLYGYKK